MRSEHNLGHDLAGQLSREIRAVRPLRRQTKSLELLRNGRLVSSVVGLHFGNIIRPGALMDGQIALLVALLRYIDHPRNPLRILWEEIYPQWRQATKSVRSPYRSRRNEPPGLAPELVAQLKRRLLVGWAERCKLLTPQGVPAEWLLNWAMQELDRGTKPTYERNGPWWLSSRVPPNPAGPDTLTSNAAGEDATLTSGQAPPTLGTPRPAEHMPIRLVVEVPPTATKADAQKVFDRAWKHRSQVPRNKNTSPPAGVGRPVNHEYFEYLALGLCRDNRKQIAKRFHVKENTVSAGARRVAERADLGFSFR
jgi:hypothetical protein